MSYLDRNIRDFAADIGGEIAAPAVGQSPASERKWPIRYHSVEAATIIFDVVTITLASLCASVLYQPAEGVVIDLGQSLGSAMLVSVLFILFLKSRGWYRPMELLIWRRQVRLIFTAWAGVFLLLSAIVFALKVGSELSRGTNMLFAGLSLLALLANRMIVGDLLSKGLVERRFSGRKIALIADPEHGGQPALSQTLAVIGLDVTGSFALPPSGMSPSVRHKLTANVIDYIRGSDIEEVIVAADLNRWPELRGLAADLRVLPFPITFIPTGSISEIFQRPCHDLGGTVCVEMQRGPLSAIEHAAKRCVDVVGASFVLITLLPLLVMVAAAIKLDSPGPILFRQRRLGFNGCSFQICKFRTMTVLEDGLSAVQARAKDDRVTRLGRWLRRTSIDELPQLLNVLAGSMSLVGPRPHAVVHDSQFDKLVRNYAFRQRVKPGLTGWAQIHGCRGPTPNTELIERRVEYDLWYIENWSLRLDLAILLRTPLEVLRGTNAY